MGYFMCFRRQRHIEQSQHFFKVRSRDFLAAAGKDIADAGLQICYFEKRVVHRESVYQFGAEVGGEIGSVPDEALLGGAVFFAQFISLLDDMALPGGVAIFHLHLLPKVVKANNGERVVLQKSILSASGKAGQQHDLEFGVVEQFGWIFGPGEKIPEAAVLVHERTGRRKALIFKTKLLKK